MTRAWECGWVGHRWGTPRAVRSGRRHVRHCGRCGVAVVTRPNDFCQRTTLNFLCGCASCWLGVN